MNKSETQKYVKELQDKISKLEKDIANYKQAFEDKCSDYGTVSELLGKYQQENEGLRQCIAELESKESVKPMRIEFHADNGEMFTPLEVANSLINQKTFKVDELRELAEHLEVYCRHNRQRCDEPISF